MLFRLSLRLSKYSTHHAETPIKSTNQLGNELMLHKRSHDYFTPASPKANLMSHSVYSRHRHQRSDGQLARLFVRLATFLDQDADARAQSLLQHLVLQ